MQTVLFISPVTLGDEVQIRQIHELFPIEALAESETVVRLEAFVGSGFYALKLGMADGDFQEQFRAFITLPEMQTFFDALRPHVESLPLPEDQTAALLLAGPIIAWEQGMRA